MEIPFAENYKIKMIEPIYRSTREERTEWITNAKFNLFNLKSNQVYIDLLSDSGTGAMSDKQYSKMALGDESYAGSSSFYELKETIKEIFDFDYFLPTHQGRGAENVLFSVIVKENDIIPGNSHFDTTKGHIEFRKAHAIDCTIDEAFDTQTENPFKGNICLEKLRNCLEENNDKIPFVMITITNNLVGGQPVSMDNIKEVRKITEEFNKPLVIDSARFAENAYFIKTRDPSYKNKTIKEIVREMYKNIDGMTMSGKKDGNSNIGGFIATRHKEWFDKASIFNIVYEGFVTYGGMTGRDMGALAQGLLESTDYEYLKSRCKQVEYLAKKLIKYGVPFQRPVGGHALFIDAKRILGHIPRNQLIAQTLAIEIYLESGVRGVEVGTLLADRDPITLDNRYPQLEFVRLAIPRRSYTNNHMKVVAVTLKNIYDRRFEIKTGYQIIHEAPILRHFTVELEKLQNK
ncbi:hypothetical protein ACTA71_009467 [Dictyostelium dimigraforme]